jgi:hypothetical protein
MSDYSFLYNNDRGNGQPPSGSSIRERPQGASGSPDANEVSVR